MMGERSDRALDSFHYLKVPSSFGNLTIVWREDGGNPKVCQVFLPSEGSPMGSEARSAFVKASPASCSAITQLGEQIQRYLEGEVMDFDLNVIALEECPAFQQKVLVADYGIPRGWVSTYGRVARSLGCPAGGRAVGSALSHNPFPIIIPCHRVVRANLELGGFGESPGMKRALLELEGLKVSESGRVDTSRICY